MNSPDILLALKPLIASFNELKISYYIGGSLASSVYGMPRATLDADIVADITSNQIKTLKSKLEKEYYIDENTIKDAIRNNSSFNLIHFKTSVKIDIFVYKNDAYQQNAIERRVEDTLVEDDRSSKFCFASPEDIIINKLNWYKIGNGVSERQWRDIIGVIKIQGNSLDKKYLKEWAIKLNLIELLKKAFIDAEVRFQ
ncbi:hypothetical protein JW879_10350 [candidate division WOR-3 bacterium]|nr:hypothetical protein [candidate division WOR-3 bacterium]